MDIKNVTIILTMVVLGISGCRRGAPTTCKGWAKYIKSPARAQRAIKQLGELRCKENIPDLEAAFDDSDYKDMILQAIRRIDAPDASIGILKKALSHPKTAILAAAVVEDFRAKALRPQLIKLLKDSRFVKARLNALSALLAIDKDNLKRDKDILIYLLQADPKEQDIRINSKAAKVLGKIRCKDAIDPMIITIFKRDAAGRQVYVPIRLALSRIGNAGPIEEHVEAVLRADFKGKNGALVKKVAETAKEYGLHKWQWKDAPELVQVLADLRNPASKNILTDLLTEKLSVPAGLDQTALNQWKVTEQNKITMAMLGLWSVGDDSVIDKLKAGVMDPENDVLQRLRMATVIALIPTTKAVETLIDIYKKTKDGRFRAPLLKPLAMAMDAAHLDKFKKILAKDKDPAVRERVDGKGPDAREFRKFLGVVRECTEDTMCYLTKLKSKDKEVSQKAVLMLGRLKSGNHNKITDALIDLYPTVPPKTQVGLDTRRYILVDLWRMGDKTLVPKLQDMLDSEKDNKQSKFWIDELQTLINALKSK